ncbi:MAG: hypothetical protein J0L83_09540 [Chitinophagales bacterium]|nr:hypothetical protein [Chitinophagales bacterium]
MANKMVEHIDFYYDEQGYMVFTEKYHLEKGYCCGHGCRHCPFDYESVPEPRKSIAMRMREESVAKHVSSGK